MIALLPMKGHSERVPGKNLKHLGGRPLFLAIADTLRATGLFSCLGVNTDSPQIAGIVRSTYGSWARVIDRPVQLIGDDVPMNAIIEYDIGCFGRHEHFLQTHSTNPFLTAETISEAVSYYWAGVEAGKFDSLFSVNALKTRLYDHQLKPLNHDPKVLRRTQDLQPVYEENSNFYIFSGTSFDRVRHRVGARAGIFIMRGSILESLDIDDPSDWDTAELIHSLRPATRGR